VPTLAFLATAAVRDHRVDILGHGGRIRYLELLSPTAPPGSVEQDRQRRDTDQNPPRGAAPRLRGRRRHARLLSALTSGRRRNLHSWSSGHVWSLGVAIRPPFGRWRWRNWPLWSVGLTIPQAAGLVDRGGWNRGERRRQIDLHRFEFRPPADRTREASYWAGNGRTASKTAGVRQGLGDRCVLEGGEGDASQKDKQCSFHGGASWNGTWFRRKGRLYLETRWGSRRRCEGARGDPPVAPPTDLAPDDRDRPECSPNRFP
jgi:hypothetical protein